MPQIKEAFDPM